MRQAHIGGDKLFVDYAGDTVPVIVDRLTGQVRPAQIFVAVMGASNFTYAEASWTQALTDWIGAHTRAFAALGGVPKLLVPDNTKVAVIKACLYEPQVNRTSAEMANHHVELEGHFYRVPHRCARSEVEVRLTPRAVEVFLKGERIAAHLRASGNHRHTTVSEHMPSSHRRYADWTVERIRREATSIGPATAALCELILERRPHPEQGFRACLGIVRLVRPFGADRNGRPPMACQSSTPTFADRATTTEENASAYPSNARPVKPAWLV